MQYRARVEDFDFDVDDRSASACRRRRATALRAVLLVAGAGTKGSYNLAGIANPAIDALIDKVIGADTRNDLTVACRALDRVFRAGRYWVPQWYPQHASDRLLGSCSRIRRKPARYASTGSARRSNWWH